MAKWFRSEDMAYVSIIVNEDAAHTCISDLGKLGMIQFTDLNPDLTAFQRRYVAYIKRIDELERKLNFFGEEVRCSSAKPSLRYVPLQSVSTVPWRDGARFLRRRYPGKVDVLLEKNLLKIEWSANLEGSEPKYPRYTAAAAAVLMYR